jgi:hypothetical protein
LESSQARETKKLKKMIADKEKFEVRTFRLEYDGETREVTQYHVKFWNDNTGLLGDEQVEMRDFLHFLVEQVDTHCRDMATGPPIIHCRQVGHAMLHDTQHTPHHRLQWYDFSPPAPAFYLSDTPSFVRIPPFTCSMVPVPASGGQECLSACT